jgi:phosphoserine phosphatase RsbU/P
MLFSAACVDLDLRTGELAFASAAHPAVCIVRRNDALMLEGGGAFLGLRARMRFEQHTLSIAPGDGVYLFTDGFSEARREGGEQFGEERLRDVVLAAHAGGQLAGAALEAAVHAFATSSGVGDDATFIGVRFGGEVISATRS